MEKGKERKNAFILKTVENVQNAKNAKNAKIAKNVKTENHAKK